MTTYPTESDAQQDGQSCAALWKAAKHFHQSCLNTNLPQFSANNVSDGSLTCPATHKFACPRPNYHEKKNARGYAMVGLTCGSTAFNGCSILAPRFFGDKVGEKQIPACDMMIEPQRGNWIGGELKTDGQTLAAVLNKDTPYGKVSHQSGGVYYKCGEAMVAGGIAVYMPYETADPKYDTFNKFNI